MNRPELRASVDGWDVVLPDDEAWLDAARAVGVGFYQDPATGLYVAPFSGLTSAETALYRIITAHIPPTPTT